MDQFDLMFELGKGSIDARELLRAFMKRAPLESQELLLDIAQETMDPLDAKLGKAVDSMIRSGEVVNAIRKVRELTGMGLKEAKDWVDEYRERMDRL